MQIQDLLYNARVFDTQQVHFVSHLLIVTENVRYVLKTGDQGHCLKMHLSWALKEA